ncbi:oligopeptide transporter [Scenedesmus sp. PABB004]|nr:oligopeptide transporter [Scenedesmus sp. PABB004]
MRIAIIATLVLGAAVLAAAEVPAGYYKGGYYKGGWGKDHNYGGWDSKFSCKKRGCFKACSSYKSWHRHELPTAWEYIAGNPDLSTLEAVLLALPTGGTYLPIVDILKSTAVDSTILAPTNKALAEYLKAVVVPANSPAFLNYAYYLITYHVLTDSLYVKQFVVGNAYPTLYSGVGGKTPSFIYFGSREYSKGKHKREWTKRHGGGHGKWTKYEYYFVDMQANALPIVCADQLVAGGGVIDVIGAVAQPSTLYPSLAAAATKAGLTNLTAAIGLFPTLLGTLEQTPSIIFAPTNAAFGALLTALNLTFADIAKDPALVALVGSVLNYHVCPFPSAVAAYNMSIQNPGACQPNLNGTAPITWSNTTVTYATGTAQILGQRLGEPGGRAALGAAPQAPAPARAQLLIRAPPQINDPNGPLRAPDGTYHLFYQHVPDSAAWDWGLVWGHATSRDLVTWRHLPPALAPTPGGPDRDGCFSGCATVDTDGTPALLYTGVVRKAAHEVEPGVSPQHEAQLIAVAVNPGDPELREWVKLPGSLLPPPPPGMEPLAGLRDPFLLERPTPGSPWWMLMVGAGLRGEGGARGTALVYRSATLTSGWELVGPLCESGDSTMWECPTLCRLTSAASPDVSRHLLTVSPDYCVNPVTYWLGDYVAGRGTFDLASADGPHPLDLGDTIYAPNTLTDEHGRTLLWAWQQERAEARPRGAYASSCNLCVPRVLSLSADGARLLQAPLPELAALREAGGAWHAGAAAGGAAPLVLAPGRPVDIGGAPGSALDVELALERGGADAVVLLLQPFDDAGVNGAAGAGVAFSWATNTLQVIHSTDLAALEAAAASPVARPRHRKLPVPGPEEAVAEAAAAASSGAPRRVGGVLRGRAAQGASAGGGGLRLRVLIDGSSVEVFACSGEALGGDGRLQLVAFGAGAARLVSGSAWRMGSMFDAPADAPAALPVQGLRVEQAGPHVLQEGAVGRRRRRCVRSGARQRRRRQRRARGAMRGAAAAGGGGPGGGWSRPRPGGTRAPAPSGRSGCRCAAAAASGGGAAAPSARRGAQPRPAWLGSPQPGPQQLQPQLAGAARGCSSRRWSVGGNGARPALFTDSRQFEQQQQQQDAGGAEPRRLLAQRQAVAAAAREVPPLAPLALQSQRGAQGAAAASLQQQQQQVQQQQQLLQQQQGGELGGDGEGEALIVPRQRFVLRSQRQYQQGLRAAAAPRLLDCQALHAELLARCGRGQYDPPLLAQLIATAATPRDAALALSGLAALRAVGVAQGRTAPWPDKLLKTFVRMCASCGAPEVLVSAMRRPNELGAVFKWKTLLAGLTRWGDACDVDALEAVMLALEPAGLPADSRMAYVVVRAAVNGGAWRRVRPLLAWFADRGVTRYKPAMLPLLDKLPAPPPPAAPGDCLTSVSLSVSHRRTSGAVRGLVPPGPWLPPPGPWLPPPSAARHSARPPRGPRRAMAGLGASGDAGRALTPRALAAGLAVGALLCFSNTYFGLQTGWVTMGSLQSAILGYGLFRGLSAAGLCAAPLGVGENVIVQTTAVATATMPLAAGLVGIVPALGLLSPADNPPDGPVVLGGAALLGWCAALAFFGVFVAVPLRAQTILRERLRFPSGAATASVIRTLHGLPPRGAARRRRGGGAGGGASVADPEAPLAGAEGGDDGAPAPGKPPAAQALRDAEARQRQWGVALRVLLVCFAASGVYCTVAAWVKPLRVLPVFDWIGLPSATAWGWVLQPSPGYLGQGMIMGPKTAWSMAAGAVIGWGVLGPHARAAGWAPGPIKSIETGAAGWLMWLGLALLLGDCLSELALLAGGALLARARRARRERRGGGGGGGGAYARLDAAAAQAADAEQGGAALGGPRGSLLELSPAGSSSGLSVSGAAPGGAAPPQPPAWGAGGSDSSSDDGDDSDGAASDGSSWDDAGEPRAGGGGGPGEGSWLLSARFWAPGLAASTALCTAILAPLLGLPLHEPLVAVAVALLVALLAVRALGQTDLNPVSGVGKISQLVFAVISPGAVVPNLVAGAIAEAGAQQAGDLMQDFKTAHLLGVAPGDQLLAMLIGSAASVPLSVGAFKLYTSAWEVPGPVLPAPTAAIWLDMARLVNGGKLPERVAPFCVGAAALAAALPPLQHVLRAAQRRAARAGGGGGAARKVSDDGAPARGAGGGGAVAAAARRLAATWRGRSALDWALALLPSGVGVAVGMYLEARWTVPRLIGSVVDQAWLALSPESHAALMMVTASGLVLGEGCASVVTALARAALS